MSDAARHPLKRPVLAVVGPTASGKTALAQAVAEIVQGEILSADSMQVYQGMDIATGKIPQAERTVAYHGLDLVPVDHAYSVAQFQRYGREVVESLDARDTPCILCGGTGFYVRAIIDDYDFPAGEQVGNTVRDTYQEFANERGAQALWDELHAADPESAQMLDPHDVKRVIRAFELIDQGTTYARQKEALASLGAYYPSCLVGIRVEPSILRARIDERVDKMVEEGLYDETKALVDAGLANAITALYAIGYRQMLNVIEGRWSMDEAVEDIKVATHQYAKRQRTWFAKDARIRWFDGDCITDDAVFSELVEDVVRCYEHACAQYAASTHDERKGGL